VWPYGNCDRGFIVACVQSLNISKRHLIFGNFNGPWAAYDSVSATQQKR
jgi:hypothetical protein